jgi:hypothetical protein
MVRIVLSITCVARWLACDRGQNAFEYLLVVGAVVTTMTIGLLAFKDLIPNIVKLACTTIDPLGSGNCLHFS